MADLAALRSYLNDLMRDPGGGRPPLTVNALFEALQRTFAGEPPVSRTTLYGWLHEPHQKIPTPALLECIPAFSTLFGISEYELYHVAGILPPEIETAASLLAAANDFRRTFALAASALASAGLSSEGEAIVIDRIMNHRLDFRMTIWPIVRGYSKEIHLHSWIVMEPVESRMSRRRGLVADLTRRSVQEQREYVRGSVITEGLWRSLGLRWRTEPGPEWPYGSFPELCLEVPVRERNRLPVKDGHNAPQIVPGRILVLSAPFGHAELVAAFLGEALGFGTIDLRYQGFPEAASMDIITRFCRQKLSDSTTHYVWSLAEKQETMALLEADIIRAAESHLIVWVSYGPLTRTLGAKVWGLSQDQLESLANTVATMVRKINRRLPIISIEYDEMDYLYPGTASDERVIDMNLLTDHVRFSAAEVLNYIYQECSGPSVDKWGNLFDDLRFGIASKASIAPRGSRVRWCPPGTFERRNVDGNSLPEA